MLDWGGFQPNTLGNLPSQSPCVSTNFWALRPTKAVLAFLDHMLYGMMIRRPLQNEQVLWNEVSPALSCRTSAQYRLPVVLRTGRINPVSLG